MAESDSSGPAERLVPLLQVGGVRPPLRHARHLQPGAVEALEAVLEHRAVSLPEHVSANVHDQVGPDADDVAVEGRVVEGTQGQAVGDLRLAERVAIRQDVRGVEQLGVAQAADGALLAVGADDAQPERVLVQPPLHLDR
jgi:hypothetical protein